MILTVFLHHFFNQITQILKFPNNILGIEYCKALLRLKSSIRPVTLRRQGMGYHEHMISSPEKYGTKNYASASAIRYTLKEDPSSLQFTNELPEPAADILKSAVSRNAFLLENDFSLLLSYCLLNETPETLVQYADVSRDLAARIINQRNQFENYTQFTELLKTKEVTYTRVQRALLHTILRIKGQLPHEDSLCQSTWIQEKFVCVIKSNQTAVIHTGNYKSCRCTGSSDTRSTPHMG